MDDQNVGQGQADRAGEKDTSAAQPTPAAPESAAPATPAPQEAAAASGQEVDSADDNPETDTDGVADEGEDEPIETPEQEPELSDNDPGPDNDVDEPTDLPEESLQADPEDRDGANDHPDAEN